MAGRYGCNTRTRRSTWSCCPGGPRSSNVCHSEYAGIHRFVCKLRPDVQQHQWQPSPHSMSAADQSGHRATKSEDFYFPFMRAEENSHRNFMPRGLAPSPVHQTGGPCHVGSHLSRAWAWPLRPDGALRPLGRERVRPTMLDLILGGIVALPSPSISSTRFSTPRSSDRLARVARALAT